MILKQNFTEKGWKKKENELKNKMK